MGRIRRGWHLTKESWGVVRADRSLALFPVIAGAASIVVVLVLFALGAGALTAVEQDWVAYVFVVLGLYAVTAVGQFFAVALAACAERSLHGEDTKVGEGIAVARSRIGVILQWAAIQLTVGLAISALQSALREGPGGAILAGIVGGIANLAWTAASFFVVPILALEDVGPVEGIKRSTKIIKERWGEGVVGSASIGGLVFLLGHLPAILLAVGGVALMETVPALGILLIAAGVLLFVAATVVQFTLTAVFRVALYRYAGQGEALGPFDTTELAGAFEPRKRRRGR